MMLTTYRLVSAAALAMCAASMPHCASAQSPEVRCDSLLQAQPADTIVVEFGALVRSFDARQALPLSYRQLLGAGIRQYLALPRSLVLDTYASEPYREVLAAYLRQTPDTVLRHEMRAEHAAYPALRGAFRVMLQRDGHLRNAHAIGGVRNPEFDAAILAALTTIDTLAGLPPVPDSIDVGPDGLDLRIQIVPHLEWSARDSAPSPADAGAGVEPILRVHLPVYRMAKQAAARPGQTAPRYPIEMRRRGIGGEVLTEFVVTAAGRVDMGSLQLLRATALPFATAVTDVLGDFQFYPMEIVAGCPVRALVEMPFEFATGRMP